MCGESGHTEGSGWRVDDIALEKPQAWAAGGAAGRHKGSRQSALPAVSGRTVSAWSVMASHVTVCFRVAVKFLPSDCFPQTQSVLQSHP